MAKKKSDGVNKSQIIRDYCEANPEQMPKEVAAAMQAQGLDVDAQFVSTVKSNAKKAAASGKTGRRGRPAGGSSRKTAGRKKTGRKASAGTSASARNSTPPAGEVSLDSLITAKKLVEEMGGVENARNALTALEQLID